MQEHLFDELLAVKTPEEGKAFFMGFANVINAMRRCPQPIIGRIHGKAVGGGVGLIAACDYAIATTQTEVKLSEIAIGIGPFVIVPAVLRKIGTAALSELSLAAHAWKSADWAHAKGLLSELHSDFDALEEAIAQHANRLATYTPQAVQNSKKHFGKEQRIGTIYSNTMRQFLDVLFFLSAHNKRYINLNLNHDENPRNKKLWI